ncbi:MAG: ABC transporter ATP-binding protein, partial [Lachnospiraceae bacterium]|nr:ABC transporter ATP-binding protein [Lachnospiraceae bacterium]
CTGSIGIVMLVPMLNLLQVSVGDSHLLDCILLPFIRMNRMQQVITLLGIYIVLLSLKAISNRQLSICMGEFIERQSLEMRGKLYDCVLEAEWEELSKYRNTDLLNLFTSQCSQYSRGMTDMIDLLAYGVTALTQLCIACWMSLPVTIFVLLLGMMFLCVFYPLLKNSRKYGKEVIQIDQKFYGEITEQLSSVKEARAYRIEEENAKRFHYLSKKFYNCQTKYVRLAAIPQMCYTIGSALLIAIVFIFSTMISNTGTAQLMVLIYIFSRLWPIFSTCQKKLQNLQSCLPACETVQSICERLKRNTAKENETSNLNEEIVFRKEIRFKNVSFSYKESAAPVLKNLSFILEYGTITALTGRSGAGKSTTADLLLGLLHATSGEITVDGKALTGTRLNSWRDHIGYVPQEPLILHASIRDNLLRFHPKATEEEMIDALKKSLAWSFVRRMEKGLDTILGDKGVRISGGERQRIVLARVLMGNPDFIILDEATSSLDYESEKAIRETLEGLRGKTTILIIAHRLETIRTADKIIVLDHGSIMEEIQGYDLQFQKDGYLGDMIKKV